MKKAVILTGGKQYIVSEGQTLAIELLENTKAKTINFEPLLVVDDAKVSIGQPTVSGSQVTAEIVEADFKAEKVTAIRYKAKKRVHKVHGHRQHQTSIKITKIN